MTTDSGQKQGSGFFSTTRIAIIAYAIIAAGIVSVLWAWELFPFSLYSTSTDFAYVRGNVTSLASQVSGEITGELVKDFDHVKKGQLLFTIDDRKYKSTVAQKKAELDASVSAVKESLQKEKKYIADKEMAEADLASAVTEQERAAQKLKRYKELLPSNAVAHDEFDEVDATYRVATANVTNAKAKVASYTESIKLIVVEREALKHQVKRNEAEYSLAQIDLGHTQIIAPADGCVSDITMHTGQYVSSGTQLLFFVPDDIWIIAHFKETQVRHLEEGQEVIIAVDAIKDTKFKGVITHFSPAAAAEFSAFRPDNATGNFTKVVQRIPVKIILEEGQPDSEKLKPGMSVIVRIS